MPCIAQMGYKKKTFSQKRLKHLKTSVSTHSNFRYIVKFPSFHMEEPLQGLVKEATQKHRGGEDGITNNRCQTFINQNLHCIVPAIKTKQRQKCRPKHVERETHLRSLEEEVKEQNMSNLPHPPPPLPSTSIWHSSVDLSKQCIAYLLAEVESLLVFGERVYICITSALSTGNCQAKSLIRNLPITKVLLNEVGWCADNEPMSVTH